MNALLAKLGLAEHNPGACIGPDAWITDPAGTSLISYNPATGEPIASVAQATRATYERVAQAARLLGYVPNRMARAIVTASTT